MNQIHSVINDLSGAVALKANRFRMFSNLGLRPAIPNYILENRLLQERNAYLYFLYVNRIKPKKDRKSLPYQRKAVLLQADYYLKRIRD